ncbi:hypothetical protein ACFQ87_46355, partial [Kitasatospora sp. NPDC056531]
MPRDLQLDIRQNPSADYTRLPQPPVPPADPPPKGPAPLDLVVTLRRYGDDLFVSAFRPGERTPRTRTHWARLTVPATTLLAKAARLRTIWRDRLISYDP